VLFADEAEAAEATAKVGDPCAFGFYWTEGTRGLGWAVDAIPTLKGGSSIGIPSPPAILLESREVVTPSIRDAERLQGFPTDWTQPAEEVTRKGQRWKLVGNAVSVPVAEWIGRRLREPGKVLDFSAAALKPHTPWPTAAWNVGQGRVRVAASEWPVRRKQQPLSMFLRYPTAPLSAKATAGFLSRAEVAPLNFAAGFLDAVRSHLKRMDQRGDFLPRL
jgi:DNA (cytosine-5)-methyltransferase 1